MKAVAMLFALMFIFVACKNEDHKTSDNQKFQDVQESQIPLEAKKALNPLGVEEPELNAAPSKPKTEGAFDFSDCKEKHGTGTEQFRACVRAKYPNMKFVE
ncbi:MAG TPA: hypothetical protein PLT31_05125 [Fibrobacteraceae bacterium]|nr:hypothetical protein [Fibrobacteraceae bacterium]